MKFHQHFWSIITKKFLLGRIFVFEMICLQCANNPLTFSKYPTFYVIGEAVIKRGQSVNGAVLCFLPPHGFSMVPQLYGLYTILPTCIVAPIGTRGCRGRAVCSSARDYWNRSSRGGGRKQFFRIFHQNADWIMITGHKDGRRRDFYLPRGRL